jgi:hypothetical protein
MYDRYTWYDLTTTVRIPEVQSIHAETWCGVCVCNVRLFVPFRWLLVDSAVCIFTSNRHNIVESMVPPTMKTAASTKSTRTDPYQEEALGTTESTNKLRHEALLLPIHYSRAK